MERQLILQSFQATHATFPGEVELTIEQRKNEQINNQFGGDKEAFYKTLAREGMTIDEYKTQIQEEIMVAVMRAKYAPASGRDKAQEDKIYREWIDRLRAEAYVKLF